MKIKNGNDNDYISNYPNENEVILFPFTFARIVSIETKKIKGEEIKIMNLDIINRKTYLEYNLKNNVNQRLFISNLD